MKKETFTQLIETLQSNSEIIEQAYKIKVDLIDFVDPWEQVITILLKEVFGEEGYEWIWWWVYEDGREAYEEVGNEVIEVPMDTAEDLYNYLKKEGYIHE
jgi:hypothetical protein